MIDKEFVTKYEKELRENFSKAQFSRLKTGKVNKIRKSTYQDIINSKWPERVGINDDFMWSRN